VPSGIGIADGELDDIGLCPRRSTQTGTCESEAFASGKRLSRFTPAARGCEVDFNRSSILWQLVPTAIFDLSIFELSGIFDVRGLPLHLLQR
jgi:hypothetical protein